MVSCIIIDDEPASQYVLETFVNTIDFLDLKGVFSNATEASIFLKKKDIHLLFLDINMPQISGLSFYKSLTNPPKVIFTTAYAEHALEGFNVNAVDYLLKPFSFERFLQAVNKLKNTEIVKMNKEYIMLKSDKKNHQIKCSEILFVEALGDYIQVTTNSLKLTCYLSLKKMYQMLPEDYFVQIHKSYIINFSKIDFIEGNQVCVSSKMIPIGKTFKANFLSKLKSI